MRTLVRGGAAVLFMIAMAFGLISMTSQSAVAGTDAAPACQLIVENGNIVSQQGVSQECLDFIEANGGIQGSGACQVVDLDLDGEYDTLQNGCSFKPKATQVPPTQVPPTQVPPTQVPPTQVPPTDVPGTEKPTDVPGTEKPTDVPGVEPTDEPGKAEPTDEAETQVEVLPSTGQGHDDGNGKAATTWLIGLVGVVFALGAYALRLRRVN